MCVCMCVCIYMCACVFVCVYVLYSHIMIHAHIYIYMLDTYRRNKLMTSEDFFRKIFTSHFICKVCVWEGVGDRTELQYIDPPLLWPSTLRLSRSPDAQPEAQGPSSLLDGGFLYCILSATSLDSNSAGGPEGPFSLAWLSLPHLVSIPPAATPTQSGAPSPFGLVSSNSFNSPTVWLFVLTELYNSSTPNQSPTRSLEWHVWSSSSGNNCHAVHRSLSSGASVYECTMGILACPIFSAQFPPTLFPLITAIRMCHFLPVHHLGMASLAGSKVKIQHMYIYIYIYMCVCVCVCVCAYICVCVYECVYICVCVSVCIYMCVCVWVCVYIYVCVCIWVCVYIYMCVCVCVYQCVYICVCVCICVCIYIYIELSIKYSMLFKSRV